MRVNSGERVVSCAERRRGVRDDPEYARIVQGSSNSMTYIHIHPRGSPDCLPALFMVTRGKNGKHWLMLVDATVH